MPLQSLHIHIKTPFLSCCKPHLIVHHFHYSLNMLGNAKKVLATEIMLQELIQCDKKLIPGNFYAQQRRKKHDESRLVFPENKEKFVSEKHETHYTLNFKKYKVICRPSGRPCSPTRRNNPHPSKVFPFYVSFLSEFTSVF